MNLQAEGVLIQKNDTVQVSEKFKKREFVIEINEEINGNIYTNFAKFQLVQNRCDNLDRWTEGDSLKVSFNLKGNRWEKDGKVNYITNLDAWKIEAASQTYQPTGATDNYQAKQAQEAFAKLSPQQQQELIRNTQSGNTGTQAGASNGYNQTNNFSPSPETIDDLPF